MYASFSVLNPLVCANDNFNLLRIIDGKHTKKSSQKQLDNAELSPEQLMLMKTQDMNYINSKLISEKRKLERLQSR